jgi:NAD(P)H-hydrate epimerase
MPLKILNVDQVKAADKHSILKEKIKSTDLMERAAASFVQWFETTFPAELPAGGTRTLAVFCGPGNNGGDGFAIARMLLQRAYDVDVFYLNDMAMPSDECLHNMNKFKALAASQLIHVESSEDWPELSAYDLVIDALLGAGLNRPVEGLMAETIELLNKNSRGIVSVDLPSGMFADKHTPGTSIEADHTFCFELPKLGLLLPENAHRVGDWHLGKIGLDADFLANEKTPFVLLEAADIRQRLMPRRKFAHKGVFGHALLVVGSYGKMGAAILSANACLRSGVGLLTLHVPKCGYDIMQVAVPEAMVSVDMDEQSFSRVEVPLRFETIGIGSGIGTRNRTRHALRWLIEHYERPMVLDADALNIIADEPQWLDLIPKGSILTPHPKEFERLFGKAPNDFERLELMREMSHTLKAVILLKGAHTAIAFPNGQVYFNSTGNPGMATAGSGDVLTGILTALLAQGYAPHEATMIGVYVHGLAGDLAAAELGHNAMIASDITRYLGKAFSMI